MTIQAQERAAKFDKAEQRWKARPVLKHCWKGVQREWHMVEGQTPVDDAGKATGREATKGRTGTCYQNQLWCRHWRAFINPSGFTCDLCEAQQWPAEERYRAHVLPKAKDEDVLVRAVERGELTLAEAERLADEFFPETKIAGGGAEGRQG